MANSNPAWWNALSKEAKKAYIKSHPNSKFAKKAKNNRSIKRAFSKHEPGSLHKALGVPKGTKLPIRKLQRLANSDSSLSGRARLVLSLQGYKKTGRKTKAKG